MGDQVRIIGIEVPRGLRQDATGRQATDLGWVPLDPPPQDVPLPHRKAARWPGTKLSVRSEPSLAIDDSPHLSPTSALHFPNASPGNAGWYMYKDPFGKSTTLLFFRASGRNSSLTWPWRQEEVFGKVQRHFRKP